jgi:hypothetical protein
MFRFRIAAFYQSLKSKVGLAAAKAAVLRIAVGSTYTLTAVASSQPQCMLLHALPSFSPSSYFHTISLSPAFTNA